VLIGAEIAVVYEMVKGFFGHRELPFCEIYWPFGSFHFGGIGIYLMD
jgi:hypothetical protein